MIEPVNDDQGTLDAGPFQAWLTSTQAAIRRERDADVPCGSCTACCTSAQFVHIEPDEADALAHIPDELLFPAPRMPAGHVLMGYDERGHCPMLVDGACSIYAHRPRTCRTYDCRVFTAAGIEPQEADKALIAARVRRWRFAHPTDADRDAHEAVRRFADRVAHDPEIVPAEMRPVTSTQLAVVAVMRHEPPGRGTASGRLG